jgi:hypothetical protein
MSVQAAPIHHMPIQSSPHYHYQVEPNEQIYPLTESSSTTPCPGPIKYDNNLEEIINYIITTVYDGVEEDVETENGDRIPLFQWLAMILADDDGFEDDYILARDYVEYGVDWDIDEVEVGIDAGGYAREFPESTGGDVGVELSEHLNGILDIQGTGEAERLAEAAEGRTWVWGHPA